MFYLVDAAWGVQSCTRNAGPFGLSATYDEQGRRLTISRGADVLVQTTVAPVQAVDTDMRGLRTIRL